MEAPSSATRHSAERTSDVDAIAHGFAAHEPWAFEAAYHAFRRSLFGAAIAVLRDREDAEDCVHDALVRVWQRAERYTPQRGSLGAFLTVCVRNEALSRRRKSANRLRIEREQRIEASPVNDNALEETDAINSAMHGLNPKQLETIRLAYYGHLTHHEIAAKLGEPLGTVKSRLSSALRTLRSRLIAENETP